MSTAQRDPVLLRADRLLTDASSEIVADGAVLVEGTRISAVGRWAVVSERAGPDVEVIELGDATLLPGLVDCHVHLAMDAGPDSTGTDLSATDAEMTCRMADSARRLLDAGVTTARDLGCRGEIASTVRDAIRDGLIAGPRMLVANAPITVTGGHAWSMGGEADGVDEIIRQVRIRGRQGSDVVKIMATGGFMTAGSRPWEARYTVEEMRAAVTEAHVLGMTTTTHAHGVEGIARAVEAGIDMIEHCGWVTEHGARFDPEVARQIVQAAIPVCPTMNSACLPDPYFCPWDSRDVLLANLRAMREAGITMVAGTDAGIGLVPFESYADGLDVLADAGMSPREVIAAATGDAAAAIGLSGRTGRLAAGLDADVTAVAGDPTEDLAALHRPVCTVALGRPHWCRTHAATAHEERRAAAERIRQHLAAGSGRAHPPTTGAHDHG